MPGTTQRVGLLAPILFACSNLRHCQTFCCMCRAMGLRLQLHVLPMWTLRLCSAPGAWVGLPPGLQQHKHRDSVAGQEETRKGRSRKGGAERLGCPQVPSQELLLAAFKESYI